MRQSASPYRSWPDHLRKCRVRRCSERVFHHAGPKQSGSDPILPNKQDVGTVDRGWTWRSRHDWCGNCEERYLTSVPPFSSAWPHRRVGWWVSSLQRWAWSHRVSNRGSRVAYRLSWSHPSKWKAICPKWGSNSGSILRRWQWWGCCVSWSCYSRVAIGCRRRESWSHWRWCTTGTSSSRWTPSLFHFRRLHEEGGTCGEVFIVDIELDGVDFDIGFSFGEVMGDVDVGVGDHLDSRWSRQYSWSLVMGGSSLFLESCSYERLSMQLYIMCSNHQPLKHQRG